MAWFSISSYVRAFWIAIAARLAKSVTGSRSLSAKTRPPRRSIVSTPVTLPSTRSGTTMLACGTFSPVPGMCTPRGSVAISLTSWARSCLTTQPARPSSIERRNCSLSSALTSREYMHTSSRVASSSSRMSMAS